MSEEIETTPVLFRDSARNATDKHLGKQIPAKPPTFPARPINGGSLDKAPPKSGSWACEPKVNGWRTMVHIPTGAMWNRHGERLSIEKEFAPALKNLRGTLDAEAFTWADCEALERRHGIGRGSLVVLDVIPSVSHATAPYLERRAWLEAVLDTPLRPSCFAPDSIYLIPSFPATRVGDLWLRLQQFNGEARCEFYEGVVFKRTTAAYPAQRISDKRETTDWVKHRWHF